MATIKGFKKRLQGLDTDKAIVKIIQDNSKEIISLNQSQLYQSSIDSLGQSLMTYRSLIYSLDKQKLNPSLGFGRPDLKLTGAFYRGFYVSVGYTGIFTIDSNDSKSAQLKAKYGDQIFGLTQENKKKFGKQSAYPKLIQYVKNRIGL